MTLPKAVIVYVPRVYFRVTGKRRLGHGEFTYNSVRSVFEVEGTAPSSSGVQLIRQLFVFGGFLDGRQTLLLLLLLLFKRRTREGDNGDGGEDERNGENKIGIGKALARIRLLPPSPGSRLISDSERRSGRNSGEFGRFHGMCVYVR